MGLQEIGVLNEGTERVTTFDLLAASGDPSITLRTLEFWRQEELLPRAERTGQHGKRPEWTYPVKAVSQLSSLIRLRAKTKNPNLLRAALWIDGYDISLESVRLSIVHVLQQQLQSATKEIDRHREASASGSDSDWAAIEKIAQKIARRRGGKALPRYGRQALGDRERAISLGLGLFLGVPAAESRLATDAVHFERMAGFDRGRRRRGELGAWLTGAAELGLEDFASVGSLPALINTIKTSTDDELVLSQTLTKALLNGLAALSHFADALTGIDNATGLGAIAALRDEPMAVAWIVPFVISLSRTQDGGDQLQMIARTLGETIIPVEAKAREFAALDPDEQRQRLPGLDSLPFIERVRVNRLMEKLQE